MVAPLAPHIAEELWQRLGHADTLTYESFPDADPALARRGHGRGPVQVNGKVRARVTVPAGADAAEHERAARADERVAGVARRGRGPQGDRRARPHRQFRRRVTHPWSGAARRGRVGRLPAGFPRTSLVAPCLTTRPEGSHARAIRCSAPRRAGRRLRAFRTCPGAARRRSRRRRGARVRRARSRGRVVPVGDRAGVTRARIRRLAERVGRVGRVGIGRHDDLGGRDLDNGGADRRRRGRCGAGAGCGDAAGVGGVLDAIRAAGGAIVGADLARLNLAAKLADGSRVAVPLVGQPPPSVDPSAVSGGAPASDGSDAPTGGSTGGAPPRRST